MIRASDIGFSVRPASDRDIARVIGNMRDADRMELAAISPLAPEQTFRQTIARSEGVMAGCVLDEPAALMGVAHRSIAGSVGLPWMLGTELVQEYQFVFLRYCKPWIAEQLDRWNTLEGWVSVDNTRSIRWLRWLGFKFEKAKPLPPYSHLFHRYTLDRRKPLLEESR